MKTLKQHEIQAVSGGAGGAFVNLTLEGVPMNYIPIVLDALQNLKSQKIDANQFISTINNAGIDTSKFTSSLYFTNN